MAGPHRAGARKGRKAQAEPHPSHSTPAPSSGTTDLDDTMNVVPTHQQGTSPQPRIDERRTLLHPTQRSFDHTEISRLSQEFEPMGINESRRSSTMAPPHTDVDADPLGAGIKDVMSAIAKLETLGLSKFDVPIPKCVVLGEQSAGKSSVIEAISRIKTPRSTDTCTRCPLYIQINSSDPHDHEARWTARVSLLKRYIFDGNAQHRPYQGWFACSTPEDQPFAEANDLDTLEQVIAAAQLAILNPGNDPKQYLKGGVSFTDTSYQRAEFSPNMVRINITGPKLAPLSFYDLPGVIGQSPDPKTQYLVQFVKTVVAEFVRQDDALILVACSLGNDIANSTAAGMARDLNASHRCVGVLTKPDCLPSGSKDHHLGAILSGTSFSLGHGYFVVKNPTQDQLDRGLTHAEARAEEEEYFRNESPWASALINYQKRFGTANLQTYLSKELQSHTLKSLPTINARINARLNEVDSKLQALPEAPTHNAVHEVCKVLQKFTTRIKLEMEGDLEENVWINLWEGLKSRFDNWLSDMRPRLRQAPNNLDQGLYGSSAAGASINNSIVVDSEDENTKPPPDTPAKKRKLESGTGSLMNAHKERNVRSLNAANASSSDYGFAKLREIYHLDQVAESIEKKSKSKIPGQLHPKVLDQLILSTIKDWDQPLKTFFSELKKGIFQHIQGIFDDEFRQWHDSPIYVEALTIVNNLLESHLSEQETTMAAEALRDEAEGPYMFDKTLWTTEKAAVKKVYKEKRFEVRQAQYIDEMNKATGTTLSKQGEATLLKNAQVRDVFLAEPYALELDVVAAISSYYRLASRRFHDAICMRIESRFLKVLRTDLHEELAEGLQIYAESGLENCVRLLEEPPERKRAREQLLSERAQLLEGQRTMSGLSARDKHEPTRVSTPYPNRSQGPPNSGSGGQSSFASGSTPLSTDMVDFRYNGYPPGRDMV